MNKKTLLLLGSATAVTFFIAGCASDGQASYIQPGGTRSLITADDLNTKDWQIASNALINSMLQSGTLTRPDGRKTIVMMGGVKNRTSEHVNTNLLTNLIRSAMLRTGKALITTAVSGRGAEDSSTHDVRELENDDVFNQATVQKRGTAIAPDMSLAGEIIQAKTVSGNRRESYFQFHLTLTDLKTGLAVWEDTKEIAKQNRTAKVGW
jgi:penicillin-binding protein activator